MINAQISQIVQISAQGGEIPKNIASPEMDAKKAVAGDLQSMPSNHYSKNCYIR